MVMNETDETIYSRFLAERNEDDFRILLERHKESLMLFLNGYVHNLDDAEELIPALKARRDDVSKRIEILREDLKCNHKIEERSSVIKDKLQAVYENELKHALSDRDRSRAAEDRSER